MDLTYQPLAILWIPMCHRRPQPKIAAQPSSRQEKLTVRFFETFSKAMSKVLLLLEQTKRNKVDVLDIPYSLNYLVVDVLSLSN